MSESTRWLWLVSVLMVGFLIYELSAVLTPFLTAALLAYMSNPVINALNRKHVPRLLAIILLFCFIALLVYGLLKLIVPALEAQISWLINQIPHILAWVQARFDLSGVLSTENIKSLVLAHWQKAGGVVAYVLTTATSSGMALIALLSNLILIPVVAFYLLRDWDNLLGKLHALIPRYIEPTVTRLARECNDVLGAFFRGQLLVMLALGIIYSVGLWVLGLQLGLLIGMFSGLLSIVPYLGFILGVISALVAGFFQFGDVMMLVLIAGVFAIGQVTEGMVLIPNLVGDRIGLHPVAVIFAILTGGNLFGFVGVLLALPAAAILVVLLRDLKNRYAQSEMYKGVV